MRTRLVWFAIRWPRDVETNGAAEAMRLLATSAGSPVILEATGRQGHVEHRFAVADGRQQNVVEQLRGTMPGVGIDELPARPQVEVERAVELRLTSAHRPVRTNDLESISRSVLAALAGVEGDETLSLMWILGPAMLPRAVPNRLDQLHGNSWAKDLALTAAGKQNTIDAEARNALRSKQAEPGWKAAARIGVKANGASRQRQLIRHVLGAIRSTEAPGVAFWVRSRNPSTVAAPRVPWRYPVRVNAVEILGLAAWPLGQTARLPVDQQRSRLLPASKVIPSKGRVIGETTFPGRERPLAISATSSLRHSYVLGPSGVGKSTLLARLIADDMAAGRAVVVIEPKSDLIRDVLALVPKERQDDVVLVDPSNPGGTVGINPLARTGPSPELDADRLLAVFKGLYGSSFGPRTTDIASAALHTLARIPGMSLVGLPLILTDAGFRRRCLAGLNDPIALEPFWATFESWSDAARAEAVAPLLNKVRPFLLRPQLRAVLGQSRPKFDVMDVFTKRRILLVDCSKGALGPETSALLASLVMAALWGATLQRSSVPAERRHPVSVYLDEFQDFLRLPTDLGDALAQARGLGVGFTLAHQYLHQLEPAMRSAVLANAQNKICFRLADEDARVLATRGSNVDAEDFSSLGAYEFYAQVIAAGSVQPWCSGRSLPLPDPTSDASAVRAASQRNFGCVADDVEAEVRGLATLHRRTGGDLGPRRRRDGGTS